MLAYRNTSYKTDTKRSEEGKSGVTFKAGMLLHVLVNGEVVKRLVDSGVTLIIISPDVFDAVVSEARSLTKLSRPIVTTYSFLIV